ncbi:hypothetical protein CLM74_04860 [Stenotrophomonas sp. MYb57]|uniref:hypothetical protein n=1 Tax=Stenotrophomonas sp. MYb57 TaxID=1827305 RepID=UPI000CF73449|nr:hypothetical protein [Stenotrophomonas sp. MYb57]AVJ32155.1 hypothetical protein CLM74_04860 [Stenotrophomonas sp. MYb57]
MPWTHDGRSVGSSSADWRLDCEARHLLGLDGYHCIDARGRRMKIGPRRHRQQYLQRVQAARGLAERDRLAAAALRIWDAAAPRPGNG